MQTNNQTSSKGLFKDVIYASAFLGLTAFLFACTKITDRESPAATLTNELSATQQPSIISGHSYYGITNSASGKFEVYDPDATTWSTPATSFKPTTALGYSATGSALFDGGTDFKLRSSTVWPGSTQVGVFADNSCVAIAHWIGTTTRGTKIWGKYWSTNSPNLHGCELLPNGNIALAASHATNGSWIRVYNTSVATGSNYAQFNLPYAHATLWDPTNSVLWVCGDTDTSSSRTGVLTALSIGGTRTAPTITEVTSMRVSTPFRDPHDISPYYTDHNKLLISDGTQVSVYNKTTKTFTAVPGAANRWGVKGVANQRDNSYIIETKGNGCCSQTWLTDEVNFYNPSTGALIKTITKPGAQFYKGKLWSSLYQ